MNSKVSVAESKQWRSYSYAMMSFADRVKWDTNHIDLCSNLVQVWECNIQHVLLLQHTSFKISFVRALNAMVHMLFCCIVVFKYVSIICQCTALANTFPPHRVASLTISKWIALINGDLFHMSSSMSLPIANARRIIPEWPNRWMLGLPEIMYRGSDTSCWCNSYCLCLWILSVAYIRSGFVMIVRAPALGMGVDRISSLLGRVGVLAMADAGLDTMRRVKSVCNIPPRAPVLWLVVPTTGVELFIDGRSVADGVDVLHRVILARWELFSEDEVVQFWPWIVQGMELPP